MINSVVVLILTLVVVDPESIARVDRLRWDPDRDILLIIIP